MSTGIRRGMIGLGALTLLAGAVGCVTDFSGPETVTGEALAEALSGMSYVGALPDGSAVCVYHAEDGRFLGRSNGLVSGDWAIEEDEVCFSYVQGRTASECRRAAIDGNRIAFVFAQIVISQGRLTEGNVCS